MSRQDTLGKVATCVYGDDKDIVIRYHAAEVVRFNEASITLNNGGYYTPTTVARMNQASLQFRLGYTVYRKQGTMYVDYRGKTFSLSPSVTLDRTMKPGN